MYIDHSVWISRAETAVLLDVDKTTVERWERFKKMPYKSRKIGTTCYYDRQQMLDFKEAGGMPKTGQGRPKGYTVKTVEQKEMEEEQNEMEEDSDPWMIRRNKPCFQYPEILINFYQPARMNRLHTIDRITNASHS